MKTCTKCGQINNDDATYCVSCGTALTLQQPEPEIVSQAAPIPEQPKADIPNYGYTYANPNIMYQQPVNQAQPQRVTVKARVCGIIGFVCGIVSLIFSWFGVLPLAGWVYSLIFSIAPAIVGLILTGISNRDGGFRLTKPGKILSIIGLILGCIFLIIGIIITISIYN